MLEQLRNSLSAQLALVPALSVLIVFSTACSHPVSTAATGEALNLSGIDVLAGDLTHLYETEGLEEMFRHAQGDTRVTTVIERLRDGGYQPEIETLRDAAYDGRVPIEALLQGLDPAMDPDVESAFSTLHDAVRADFVLHTSLGGEVGARREALVWWVVTIIVVVAVAVVAALYSYACMQLCLEFCNSQGLVAVSCAGGSVKAGSKSAAISLCAPACAPPPPPPTPPAPPAPVLPPPCPEPSTSQNLQECEEDRQACREAGGTPVDGTAARCDCQVHCLPAPEPPPPVEPPPATDVGSGEPGGR